MPGNLAHEAAEKRLFSPIIAAEKPYPTAAALAEREIAADLPELALTADGNAFEAACGDKATL